MKALIYDVNNWIRVKLSTDGDSLTIYDFWNEVLYNSREGYSKIQIFVSDGINSRKKRRELYPEYKAKRKPADQSIYDGINLFKNLLKYAPKNVYRAEIPYTEADDVIAHLVKNELSSCKEIDIISTDKDLTQLLTYPNVKTLANPPCEPKYIRLYKTLVGDNSDNIKGIPGFGKSAWEKLPDLLKDEFIRYFSEEYKGIPETLTIGLDDTFSGKTLEKIYDALYTGELDNYWKIVGFFPIDEKDLKLIPGEDNLTHVNSKLNDLFIL